MALAFIAAVISALVIMMAGAVCFMIAGLAADWRAWDRGPGQ